jgi:2-polyprenyl-6-methoxyphenol hydroxylase-like FAD-dependent oxidoreductase
MWPGPLIVAAQSTATDGISAAVTEVLIVGAGPTGLVLALWLARQGIGVRIIDKSTAIASSSRALAVQARTLEFYRQFGFADALVHRSRQVPAINLWVAGKVRARAVLADMGARLSPFPQPVIYPQDEHEHLLVDQLSALGVSVERNTELIDFVEGANGIVARLRNHDGTTQACEPTYIAGCDGAHSTVRAQIGAAFPGGDYEHMFYVADVQARGPVVNGELHVGLDPNDFLAVFPLHDEGRVRLIGTIRGASAGADRALSWSDVSDRVLGWLRIDVANVNWFSTYRVHHRVAQDFRRGRAFLLGDAAHIHSPVGGQGMNTGIGDAVNLAWKLTAVLRKKADVALLTTYEEERCAFARRLVATTDKAFTGVVGSRATARFVRLRLVPFLLPMLLRVPAMRRLLFRTVSQIGIEYRSGRLSAGKAGRVHGGDRLPWVQVDAGDDNFVPLQSLDWQVHVYGEPSRSLVQVCLDRRLYLHSFSWQPHMRLAGLLQDAYYLIRPDGYVALADPGADAIRLERYLGERAVL